MTLAKCVVTTIEGPFQVDDMLAVMARQRAERTWTYGILYDLRSMTGEPTTADLQLLSERARGYLGQPPLGPVALLTVDPTSYERLSDVRGTRPIDGPLTIGVFRDWEKAEQWLTTEMRETRAPT